MSLCAYIKAGGGRCEASAMRGYEHCYGHRPDLAEERRRNAQRGGRAGGRGRPQSETDRYKGEIRTLIDRVLKGEVPSSSAAVIFQGYNTIMRICEVERRRSVAHALTPEELSSQMQTLFGVIERHLTAEQLKALDEDLAKILVEGSG